MYATLSLIFWGVSPICATLCLNKYGLVTSQWQLLDTATKVVTALVLQQVFSSTLHDEPATGGKGERQQLSWLQLPLLGVAFGVLDGVLGGLAAWCQGRAIELQAVPSSTIVSFTSLFPILTKLLSVSLLGESLTLKQSVGIVASCIATMCFIS